LAIFLPGVAEALNGLSPPPNTWAGDPEAPGAPPKANAAVGSAAGAGAPNAKTPGAGAAGVGAAAAPKLKVGVD